jgi:hypothetical protein
MHQSRNREQDDVKSDWTLNLVTSVKDFSQFSSEGHVWLSQAS